VSDCVLGVFGSASFWVCCSLRACCRLIVGVGVGVVDGVVVGVGVGVVVVVVPVDGGIGCVSIKP